MWVWVLALLIATTAAVTQLNSSSFVATLSSDPRPFLVAFRASSRLDGAIDTAMDRVEALDEAHAYRYGVVRCDRPESVVLCREALAMHSYPWVVFFHRGVWQLGTTWEYVECSTVASHSLTLSLSQGAPASEQLRVHPSILTPMQFNDARDRWEVRMDRLSLSRLTALRQPIST